MVFGSYPVPSFPLSQPYREIGDYNLIGDGRTSALVAIDGAIDWCCLPRFDSPTIFSRLVDAPQGGYFAITDAETNAAPQPIRQRYVPSTAILQTEVYMDTGRLLITDFMPTEHLRGHVLPEPPPRIVRRIEALDESCRLIIHFKVSPDYEHIPPLLTLSEEGVLSATPGVSGITILSFADMKANGRIEDLGQGLVKSVHLLKPRDRLTMALGWSPHLRQAQQLLRAFRRDWTYELEATRSYWQDWAAQITYYGPYRQTVIRSAITLKLLTNAPTSAPFAAALPEPDGKPASQEPVALSPHAGILGRQVSHLRESQDIRFSNRQLILRRLREQGSSTRAALAKTTRLSRTTIGAIVVGLLETGLVREGERLQPSATGGRRPIRITFHPQAGIVLGVHLTANSAALVATNLMGSVLASWKGERTPQLEGATALLTRCRDVVKMAGFEWERVEGIGLALPPETASSLLFEELQEQCPFPVSCAAPLLLGTYGEQRFGLGSQHLPLIYVQLSPQIGIGIIRTEDERPREGILLADLLATQDGEMAIPQADRERLTGDLPAALSGGDPGALSLLDRLAVAVFAQVHLFHPQAIVLDCENRAQIPDYLRMFRQQLNRRSLAEDEIQLAASQTEPHSVVLGAASLALDGVYGIAN